MTDEEHERQAAAEQEALKMLNLAMKEGRWYPRKHMRFAITVVLPIFILVLLLIIWIASIVSR